MANDVKLELGIDESGVDKSLKSVEGKATATAKQIATNAEQAIGAVERRMQRAMELAQRSAGSVNSALMRAQQQAIQHHEQMIRQFGTAFNREIVSASATIRQLRDAMRFHDQFSAFTSQMRAAFRDFTAQVNAGGRAAKTALESGLDGGIFSRLRDKARSAFASIKSEARGLLSGLGGGGGGGGGLGGLVSGGGLGSRLLGGLAGRAGLGASGLALGGAGVAVTGGIAAALTAKEIFEAVVPAGLDFNETIESAEISLKRLLGSSAAARAEIERLKKDALSAPIDFTQLLELDQKLLNAGFSLKTLREGFVEFTQGTALISGTKGLQERLEGIATALSQMAGKGRASNEELSQLAERQIPIYKLLGDAIGRTTDEVFRLAESGQLDGLKTAELIFKSIAKEAASAGPEIKESFAVLRSNLDDLFQQTSGRATENIFKGAKDTLKLLTSEGAQSLANSLAGFGDQIGGVFVGGLEKALEFVRSGKLPELGSLIPQGLAQGIGQTAQSAWDKVKELGQGVISTIEDVLQMKSPSRVMQDRGRVAADSFIDTLVDRTSEGFKRWGAAIEKAGGDEFIRALEAVAKRIGANPNELLNVIAFESRINPQARNPRGTATGLIQFVEKTAGNLGTTTDQLRTMSAIDQLKFVEKYLLQFGKVLDTQEKLYTAVIAGRVVNDPGTVLFRDAEGKAGKAFRDNRELDRDRSGTITAAEAAFQARKQGFTSSGRGGVLLRDDVAIISDVKAQMDLLPLSTEKFIQKLDGIPPELQRSVESLRTVTDQTGAATVATEGLSQATNKTAEQAANFASIWKNPLLEDIKKARTAIDQIGQNLDSKKLLAELEAIREIKQADEDAILSQVKNRVRLADATVYHSERANAAVLEHLTRETRGVTEIMAQAKIGIVDAVFGGADRAIDKLTSKLGFFKGIVADILSGLSRLVLSPVLGRLFGGNAGGGFSFGNLALAGAGGGNFGGFATPSFNPNAAAGGALGIGNSSLTPAATGRLFESLIARNRNAPVSLSDVTPAAIGGLNGAKNNIFSGLFGNLSNLTQGIGFGKARGSGGALASLLPFLGASLGSGLGGQSRLGQILGGIGGGLLGVGLTAAPAIIGAGGALSSLGFLAPLFSNPLTAIAGAALLPLAFLAGRAKQRRQDEAISGDSLQNAINAIFALKSAAQASELTSTREAEASFKQIHAQFVAETQQLKTRSVRESRLANQADITPPLHKDSIRLLFEREVLPEVLKAKKRAEVFSQIVPEFDVGGLHRGVGFALLHDREMILNLKQQQRVRSIAGPDVFQRAGVPNAPSAGPFQGGGIYSAPRGDDRPMEITLHVSVGLSESGAEEIVVSGIEASNGRKVLINTIKDARRSHEL